MNEREVMKLLRANSEPSAGRGRVERTKKKHTKNHSIYSITKGFSCYPRDETFFSSYPFLLYRPVEVHFLASRNPRVRTVQVAQIKTMNIYLHIEFFRTNVVQIFETFSCPNVRLFLIALLFITLFLHLLISR